MKKFRLIIILVFIMMPVLAYAGITVANNRIAGSLEQDLLNYPLPPQTELLDSAAIAAKVAGNGNGMQYIGALLVKSGLTEDELQEYYDACPSDADYAEVLPQETEYIFEYQNYRFDNWQAGEGVYRVALWSHSVSGCEDTAWEAILNCDIRGQ